MSRIIFIFMDGVGIGRRDESNPFYVNQTSWLPFYGQNTSLPDGTPIKAIDATMGVTGIPTSATGQTALFTGHNVAARFGHRLSFPDKPLRRIIKENNLFSRLLRQQKHPRFLNVYPLYGGLFTPENIRLDDDGEIVYSPVFPDRLKKFLSVTTCMILANQMTPFNEEDIRRERALYQDFSNRLLIEKGLDLRPFTPTQAAEILHNTSREYDLLLYEFFLSDLYGHQGDHASCKDLVTRLDELIGHLISRLDPGSETLLLTSDHGNIEDLSTRSHTTHPVPLISWGQHGQALREQIHGITDVTPAIEAILQQN